jgi:hypothetical protein
MEKRLKLTDSLSDDDRGDEVRKLFNFALSIPRGNYFALLLLKYECVYMLLCIPFVSFFNINFLDSVALLLPHFLVSVVC